MAYNVMSMPLSKEQTIDGSKTAQSYHNYYKYEDSDHPSAPSQIGHEHYTYDANGNPTRVENDSTAAVREMYWDEDNRLIVLSDNGKTSRYTYNHAGERTVKSHGSMEGVYINGAPQGITFHETDEYTLYPASIISVNKNRFTKHYFIGDKRVASRIGSGSFNNVYGQNGSFLTAGQQDYAERMSQIENQREDYYRELGIAPGIPTMKGSYGDPENTGVGYNTIIKELGDHTVPAEWAQYVKHNEVEGSTPGAPILWDDPSDPESALPGYGFVADNSGEPEETFYYHSDHLGSTSYITDKDGNITQYDAYLPYGELLVDEHSSSEDLPYKFNGKELDEETGLYYYGARYMQPMASIWYGVDPLTEDYNDISGYVYCHNNPIGLYDPNGMDDWEINSKGIIVNRIENKERDAFFIVNNAGKRIKNKSLSFAYGTIEKQWTNHSKGDGNYDLFKVRGDVNGQKIFEFFANNTSVEWSHFMLGKSGNQGLNLLITSHKKGEEYGAGDMMNHVLSLGYTIREHRHNHPSNSSIPSGMYKGDKQGDIFFAKNLDKVAKKNNGKTPIYSIYTKKTRTYTRYSQYSTFSDFGRGENGEWLNNTIDEVVVVSRKMKK